MCLLPNDQVAKRLSRLVHVVFSILKIKRNQDVLFVWHLVFTTPELLELLNS
jgi:hypothetical protein